MQKGKKSNYMKHFTPGASSKLITLSDVTCGDFAEGWHDGGGRYIREAVGCILFLSIYPTVIPGKFRQKRGIH